MFGRGQDVGDKVEQRSEGVLVQLHVEADGGRLSVSRILADKQHERFKVADDGQIGIGHYNKE